MTIKWQNQDSNWSSLLQNPSTSLWAALLDSLVGSFDEMRPSEVLAQGLAPIRVGQV